MTRRARIRAQRQAEWWATSKAQQFPDASAQPNPESRESVYKELAVAGNNSASADPSPAYCTTRASVGEKEAHQIYKSDYHRLATQLQRVARVMSGGHWMTLEALAYEVGGSEAGVSARLRDLRQPRHGGWTVNRRRIHGGLWEYQMLPKPRETISNELLCSAEGEK